MAITKALINITMQIKTISTTEGRKPLNPTLIGKAKIP